MSLQECLAYRKDCSGVGRTLSMSEINTICKSTYQAAPSHTLFVILPDGPDYKGGIYRYNNADFTLISDKEKTKFTMEVYPELVMKENIDLKELIRVGITWQYLSLKAGSLNLGVSQRARAPKKFEKIVNEISNENYKFLYSVAVRERDLGQLLEDSSTPIQKDPEENVYFLDIPDCYKNRALYKNEYKGVPLDSAIFNQMGKKTSNPKTIHEISQLLWACQGENDHATHGNRDSLEKNGYGRVHATGCAGYSVYPIVIIDNLADLPKGAYLYNPVGCSALNRWVQVKDQITYDHFLLKYSLEDLKTKIENEFDFTFSNYMIALCIDRKKPCSGFMHRNLMNTTNWAEIEAGMALAGLQLQANALGLQWQKIIVSNPDDPKYRALFDLDAAEKSINEMANNLVNLPKNERLSLKGNLIPAVLFFLKE